MNNFKFIPLPLRSTKETREYAQAIEKGLNSYFVIQSGKGWYVRKASTRKSNGKLFANKADAVEQAKKLSVKRKSEFFVFSNKGELLYRESAV